jgi:VIT1/CCC1 family predicted Fe2+/Mn2+ transporter
LDIYQVWLNLVLAPNTPAFWAIRQCADVLKAAIRVTFWGALAMALTAGIGAIVGTVV